ncbi:AraC family transcriptional regulator [Stenotrophomonas sp. SY1]|uniref:helix-turn-helix domain-containing protein n=1 Tax=Stenotrophomonas sp. SY1 TaxID=477235 RepID=UPI001E2CC492|nr:AraC family transcriptional regulator [Stenotrophomonas sp. SY1]MCD9087670.1 AraC family transcriptional regulator [Stenotrophomonas sp. SY1]
MTMPASAASRQPTATAGARSRTLFAGERLSARVSWYAPGLRMQRHTHDCHQLSLLLLGTLGEQTPQQEVRLATSAVGLKPAGLVHANDYGPSGALILGINLPTTFDLKDGLGIEQGWQWREQPASMVLARGGTTLAQLLTGDLPAMQAEASLWELLATMVTAGQRPPGAPPRWLALACERLREEPVSLATLAREQGLHPVYFARAFARWIGCTPSAFRMRAQLQRALPLLAAGHSLATAACQAGFADQAHLSRVTRQHSGLTPARLAALLRE